MLKLPAQISFPFLLLTCLYFLHYFAFQLNAALLNGRLENEQRQHKVIENVLSQMQIVVKMKISTLTADAISDMSSPMYSFPVPLKGILVLTILTNTPILS